MPPLNTIVGWTSITAGFAAGMLLGLGFHRENWLGGYLSFSRQLLRLGHIAMISLGMINVLYGMTVASLSMTPDRITLTKWGFIVGNITMPLTCGLVAFRPAGRMLFAIPVAALLTAGITLCIAMVSP